MFRKLISGGVALAVAAAALLLVSVPGSGDSMSEAAIDGIIPLEKTVGVGGESVVTVDADEGGALEDATAEMLVLNDVRMLATTGDYTGATCDSATFDGDADVPVDCTLLGDVNLEMGRADRDFTVDDDSTTTVGNNRSAESDISEATGVNRIMATWMAPFVGPGTATLTAIQGSSIKSTNVKYRGAASTVELSILTAVPRGSSCTGVTAEVIRSATVTDESTTQETGVLCTSVKDSGGSAIPSAVVIYSTSDGALECDSGTIDTTSVEGAAATGCIITSGTNGHNGEIATITASSGGKIATADIAFGGNPASCTLTPDQPTVEIGGASTVAVDIADDSGGPVADGTYAAVIQVNPGGGANATIIGSPAVTVNGAGSVTLIAALAGPIALAATAPLSDVGGAIAGSRAISCTGTVTATGTVTMMPPPTGGAATTEGFAPGAGQNGLTLFHNLASAADAYGLVCGSNDVGSSLSMTNASGQTFLNVNGAPALANQGFSNGITFGGSQSAYVSCA